MRRQSKQEEILTFSQCMEKIIELENDAKDKMIEALKKQNIGCESTYGFSMDISYGKGRNTHLNDRRMYIYITAKVKGMEFLIDLVYSEIDNESGNCHSQLGRIKFVKDFIINTKGSPTSPNEILSGRRTDSPTIRFNSYKWVDPMDYIDKEVFDKVDCFNSKWLTVDDINNNEMVPDLVAEAFCEFIKKTLEVPHTT